MKPVTVHIYSGRIGVYGPRNDFGKRQCSHYDRQNNESDLKMNSTNPSHDELGVSEPRSLFKWKKYVGIGARPSNDMAQNHPA